MIKSSIRLRGVFILLLFLGIAAAFAPWWQPRVDHSLVLPPTQVVMTQAELRTQGVQLAWLAAQPGSHPVAGYIVERNRKGTGFAPIAHLQKHSVQYFDAEGQERDIYRVIAVDSRQPSLYSIPSESVAATVPHPGANLVHGARVLGVDTLPPADHGEAMAQAFVQIDTALNNHDTALAIKQLGILRESQQYVLSRLQEFSPAEQARFSTVCAQHIPTFETNLHILPEASQLDGLVVAASCNVIRENAQ